MGGYRHIRGRGAKDPNLCPFTCIESQPLFQHLQGSGCTFLALFSYAFPIHGPTKPQDLLTLLAAGTSFASGPFLGGLMVLPSAQP